MAIRFLPTTRDIRAGRKGRGPMVKVPSCSMSLSQFVAGMYMQLISTQSTAVWPEGMYREM